MKKSLDWELKKLVCVETLWASAVKWGYAPLTGPGRIKGDHLASGTELTAPCGRDRSQAAPG